MNQNTITIDPSLSCTALVVNGEKFVFVNRNLAYTETKTLKKWFSLCSSFIHYEIIDYDFNDNYSENEIYKLTMYESIVERIHDKAIELIDPTLPINVYIEGYSYSSAAGPLIDLVTFSTLLRRIMTKTADNVQIISPSSLKLSAAKLTYSPIISGKKVIKHTYKNNEGIAGGSFKKTQMLQALIENQTLNCKWVKFLRENKEELLSLKNIPKPIEDLNDAFLMYIINKN